MCGRVPFPLFQTLFVQRSLLSLNTGIIPAHRLLATAVLARDTGYTDAGQHAPFLLHDPKESSMRPSPSIGSKAGSCIAPSFLRSKVGL